MIAQMIYKELDLLRNSSKLKLKLVNEFNWDPIQVFEQIDERR